MIKFFLFKNEVEFDELHSNKWLILDFKLGGDGDGSGTIVVNNLEEWLV